MSIACEVAVAVVADGGCYLIGRRPDGVELSGLWEFPGGKIEPGELPSEAAIRECEEEAGLRISVDGQYETVDHAYDHATLRIHFLACTPLDRDATPRPPFRWVPAAELDSYTSPAANHRLIRQLSDS
ncbi:MAG: (deoxy)nucleoside triphosphate pyrophosphohydrolase [Pirellulales bacterium]